MLEIDEHREYDDNSGKSSIKTVIDNNYNADKQSNKNKHNTINSIDNIEPDRNKLLEPNAEFIRSDNSISSTTSRDLNFCINTVLKEVVKEEKLVRQVFHTMLSAYTNDPINLAINAPPGEGKSHVLTMVGNLFPTRDIIFIAGMSSKAIFHKNGYTATKNEEGEYVKVESELEELKEWIRFKSKELVNVDRQNSSAFEAIKNEMFEYKQRVREIERNAVKVINLSHKILVFLDTPSPEIFEALMALLSHDRYEVEYQFVDTSTSRTGIRTRTNVLVGWPSVIFAQAIDYTRNSRYPELQRRFIITNPRMDIEKYRGAMGNIVEKNCLPDFVYQQKVVSEMDKDLAKEIIYNIKDDLLSFSSKTKLGRHNTLVPFTHLIQKIMSNNYSSQGMTFANRLMKYVVLLSSINFRKRPYIEIKPAFRSDSFRIPMTLYSDLAQAISLINNFHGGIRPYVSEWYYKVFLEAYNSKSQPNSKIDKAGLEITEQRIAVTTTELIEKTKEVMNKTLVSKSLLQEFIYPLLNTGYIDLIRSELDKRAKIYFPALPTPSNKDEDKYSNLFLFDKKNNVFENSSNDNVNIISNEDKNLITCKIEEVMRYSSENGNLTTLGFADYDVDQSPEEYDEDKTVQQIVDKYYSEFFKDHWDGTDDEDETEASLSKTTSSEEYLRTARNECILQYNSTNYVKNNIFNRESSNKLFSVEKKNNLIYSCYRCKFETDSQTKYEKHCVLNHPGKPAYPGLADLEKDGLKPQEKPWE